MSDALLVSEIARLREALREARQLIGKVLDDSESRPGGWGPDVTCVAYLDEAAKVCDAALDGRGGAVGGGEPSRLAANVRDSERTGTGQVPTPPRSTADPSARPQL